MWAGGTGLYGFTLQSATDVDMPYVQFQYGIPELGTNPTVFGLPYTTFSTNLGGSPNVPGVPWADLASAVNTDGGSLAPGSAVGPADGRLAALSSTAATYPGLADILAKQPSALEFVDPALVAFQFHILATATPLTRDEFIAQQTQVAATLRAKVLA